VIPWGTAIEKIRWIPSFPAIGREGGVRCRCCKAWLRGGLDPTASDPSSPVLRVSIGLRSKNF
jgi:hypothetical protein